MAEDSFTASAIRREDRRPVEISATVVVDGHEQAMSLATRDLSQGGCFLRCSDPPSIGAPLKVTLVLAGNTFVAEAKVAHRVDPALAAASGGAVGMGVSFVTVTPAARRVLTQFLDVVDGATASALAASMKVVADPTALPDERLEEVDLATSLYTELARLREASPFGVLGLDVDATDGDVQAALQAWKDRWHPETFRRIVRAEVRDLAAQVVAVVEHAAQELSDPSRRQAAAIHVRAQRTIQKRAPVPESKGKASARPAMSAEAIDVMFREGEDARLAGNLHEAKTILAQVIQHAPDDPRYQLANHLALAALMWQFGQTAKSTEHYRAALKLDPENAEAIRAVRGNTREEKTKTIGFLARLLKR